MTRTAQQNQKIKDIRKEQIRLSALMQFASRGFYATRIKDIADTADMAQGLLYHYYPSKEAIFIDLVEDAVDKLNEACLYAVALDTPSDEKIRRMLTEIFKTIEGSDRFRQTCCLIAQSENLDLLPDQARRRLEEKRELPYSAMASIMKQGQAEGNIVEGDPHDLAVLFWTSINGLAIYQATRSNAGPLPDSRLLSAMFLKNNGRI
jgi:AcrR family transcriptional regulator